MNGFDLQSYILQGLTFLPGLVVGFTVHELAHALVAYALGDRGEHTRARLTLNPLRHISWLGMAAFLLIHIGWAKPVRFDPRSFKNPNLDSFLVAIAGVTANFLTAVVWGAILLVGTVVGASALALRGVDSGQMQGWLVAPSSQPWVMLLGAFTFDVVWVNLVLASFNLLPFPGLDGFQAAMRLYLIIRGLFHRGEPTPPWFDAATTGLPPSASTTLPDPQEAPAGPSTAAEWVQRGSTYQNTGLLREAIDAYRAALQLDPAALEAYWGLARAYRMLGERRQAIAALGAALPRTIDPTTRDAFAAAMRDWGWRADDPVPALDPPV